MGSKIWEEFMDQVTGILNQGAKDKGYDHDRDGGKTLNDFVATYFKGHSLGEIVYKAVRYQSRQDPTDLLKIAAWAYLEWAKSDPPVRDEGGPAPLPGGTYVEIPRPRASDDILLKFAQDVDIDRHSDSNLIAWGLTVDDVHRARKLMREYQQRTSMSAARGAVVGILESVGNEAIFRIADRPRVLDASTLRLAALVSEESGEAIKEAIEYTRTLDKGTLESLKKELTQTAAMAVIALAVLKGRE